LIQDTIKLTCSPDEKGVVSEAKKEWVARMMVEMTPLVYLLGKLLKGAKFAEMLKYSSVIPQL
jgi:hypothetical protein